MFSKYETRSSIERRNGGGEGNVVPMLIAGGGGGIGGMIARAKTSTDTRCKYLVLLCIQGCDAVDDDENDDDDETCGCDRVRVCGSGWRCESE